MASIVLGAVGTALGASTGLPFASTVISQLGSGLGRGLDSALFPSSGKSRHHEGPRLADLAVQTSTYGKTIPIVYGSMRIGGNIIWSRPISETAVTTSSSSGGGKGGGGKATQSATSYYYSITLAIGICEGPLDEVTRIWADARQLDLSCYTLRMYRGDEEQLPDSLIQSFEGADNTPAYRGMAYVVFEDFPLADFGNRIPNFTFEIRKKAQYPDYNGEALEEMITGITLIPGGGEFVYDTQVAYKIPGASIGGSWVQQGNRQRLNMHNAAGKANALLALDQLAATCPNLEWVSVVVSWFGTSMDAGSCNVLPGVEYAGGAITTPHAWQVGGFDRATAHAIMMVDGAPQYGGTPDDGSILRLLAELKARGYKIMFYPILFMDVSGKPWRGNLTGSAGAASDFFTKANGYNAFIMHYAALVGSMADAFIIGSELKGLTAISDTPGSYPAVGQLVSLAASVKATVGSGCKVTYAADWSEYHHADGGWYNLDPLWASPDIDMIGIDAYFPLSDAPQAGYDIDALIEGWTSGEGYDWYYTDADRSQTASLSAPFAWKNLQWFWENTHTNPDSSATSWVPQSKPIWFTEYGYPSVDGAANQPNVFYDPGSSASAFPHFSKGRVDFMAQRAALTATQAKWKSSPMVEQTFIWTWDARPYPYWPDLAGVWSDGAAWKTGHWVQGKLGISSLAAIVQDLCLRAGLTAADSDVSAITRQVEGFVIASQQTIRDAVETLQLGYFFDVVESAGVLTFVPRGGEPVCTIAEDDLVPFENDRFTITRAQEIELPRRINVVYLSRLANYHSQTQYAQRETTASRENLTVNIPVVMSDQVARNIADSLLFSMWMGRTGYQFTLPLKYSRLEPADVIAVTVAGVTHRMRITSTMHSAPCLLQLQAVAEDASTFDFYMAPGAGGPLLQSNAVIADTQAVFLDMPALPGDDPGKGVLRIGVAGLAGNWTGCALYRSDDGGGSYQRVLDINNASIMGNVTGVLADGPAHVFDRANRLTVILLGEGELQSITEGALFNGGNAAMVGSEMIQFTSAALIEPGKYELSGLLRGRLGTEWATGSHSAGEAFVLLDAGLGRLAMAGNLLGLPRSYKPVSFGAALSQTQAQDFTYGGVALKPYSPAHVSGRRDGSGNLTIGWIRRTRLGGNWLDHADVPLNESSERYEVDILSGGGVVRTLTGLDENTASYSADQQLADFGAVQPAIEVAVYQLSDVVGRGIPAYATL